MRVLRASNWLLRNMLISSREAFRKELPSDPSASSTIDINCIKAHLTLIALLIKLRPEERKREEMEREEKSFHLQLNLQF